MTPNGLSIVAVTRYVTPLREGGSLPGVVEGDDLGTYVCKFRGAGQGTRVLVAEVVVSELARRLGLRTPRLVVLDLDPELARYEADEEVQDLLNASPGHNLGIDFLPGAFGVDGQAGEVDDEGARVLWLDAFTANVDRSWRNPNLLLWHGDLWLIDHGASLYFHHGWSSGPGDPARFAAQPWDIAGHVFESAAGRARELHGDDRGRPRRRGVRRGPLAGAGRVARGRARSRDPRRAACGVRLLPQRPSGRRRVAAGRCRMKLAFQYVVLRCVPRPDREEFLNVGVVLHCQAADFLDAVWHVDADRLRSLDAGIDVDQVCEALAFVDGVCRGDDRGGEAARQSLGQRFGFLKAPRSTVLQPGPVHGGMTDDPARQLEHLRERLVG